MRISFGTDGVRGLANSGLTAGMAYAVGWAAATVISGDVGRRPAFLVGTDTRISCGMLEGALVAGICAAGGDALCAGVIPTPAVSLLVAEGAYDAGAVISASHNAFHDNGIKLFGGDGGKLGDEMEGRIEALANRAQPESGFGHDSPPTDWADSDGDGPSGGGADRPGPPIGGDVGRRKAVRNAGGLYANALIAKGAFGLEGLSIAVDCANGSAYKVAPAIFRRLGAKVRATAVTPNGININDGCGSTNIGKVTDLRARCGADVGVAFDGDADRVMMVDEEGGLVCGDKLMAIIALALKERGALAKETVAVTVMSNAGLTEFAARNGIRLDVTAVGDRHILGRMSEAGYSLGGEQSGHILMSDYVGSGDGIFTALFVLQRMVDTGKRLSELASVIGTYPQVIENAAVDPGLKGRASTDKAIERKRRQFERELGGAGRILIRPSGTESLVRVMVEGSDIGRIAAMAKELASLIEGGLGRPG